LLVNPDRCLSIKKNIFLQGTILLDQEPTKLVLPDMDGRKCQYEQIRLVLHEVGLLRSKILLFWVEMISDPGAKRCHHPPPPRVASPMDGITHNHPLGGVIRSLEIPPSG
jgi:hypothetical protein